MSRTIHVMASLHLAVVVGLAFAHSAARAEERVFSVTVDNKPAGTYRMAASTADDGAETITTSANINIRILFINYRYSIATSEVWKDGRLVSLTSTSNDNGTKRTVNAMATDEGLKITADGRDRTVRGNFVTTTGWRAPTMLSAPQLLDTENGTQTPVRIQHLGQRPFVAGGAPVAAQVYRLLGRDVDSVWWFDDSGRAVRQEMKWDGHNVVLQLESSR